MLSRSQKYLKCRKLIQQTKVIKFNVCSFSKISYFWAVAIEKPCGINLKQFMTNLIIHGLIWLEMFSLKISLSYKSENYCILWRVEIVAQLLQYQHKVKRKKGYLNFSQLLSFVLNFMFFFVLYVRPFSWFNWWSMP